MPALKRRRDQRATGFRVLVCGGRDWTDGERIRTELEGIRAAGVRGTVEVIHGAAHGPDSMAGDIARGLGYTVTEYPANWRTHGKAAGPIRNRLMLETYPDLVVAFKDGLDRSLSRGGTENMIRIALDAGVPCRIIGDERVVMMYFREGAPAELWV